ncbi:unnamed protein product [Linum tenue]|uniref:F-box domain-containing protein n=1 Tax=Linum tenue TaxID=586396 RepID=A0AAV0JWF0_9ROSI|nr:unnamed protein product [Linum tenue]
MSASNSTSASDRQLSSRLLPCSTTKRRRIHSTEADPPPPATTIVQLGDDFLVEILIRLPNPRSACRCKAVCKRWKSLISNPIRFNRRFVSHHQSRNRQPVLLLPSDDPQAIIRSVIPMTTLLTQSSFAVMDSYKDLVLCGFSDVGPAGGRSALEREIYRSYFLCNPLTKQWVALPLAPELPLDCGIFFTRLVCEPRISNDLDLGEEQVFAYSSEYRFRVVCLYLHEGCTKINMFCSDTGEWTKDILVLREHCQFATRNVVSCNGEVFWCYGVPNQEPVAMQHQMEPFIAAFNPFHPDIPPTAIEPPLVFGKPGWDVGVSQGALHAIVFEDRIEPGRSQITLSVWRLEEDRKSWRKVCDGSMKGPRLCELRTNLGPCLHPEKPQVFYLRHSDGSGDIYALSCDLRAGGELELFAKVRGFLSYWYLFRSEIPCWSTSIPRYKQLRVMYDGSYSCWFQSNNEPATTPPIAGNYFAWHSLLPVNR